MSRLNTLLTLHEQTPSDSFILYALATEYGKMGDWKACIEHFTKLEMADPDYVGLYYHLGKACEKNQDLEAAIAVYKRGILVADRQGDRHAKSELMEALMGLEEE